LPLQLFRCSPGSLAPKPNPVISIEAKRSGEIRFFTSTLRSAQSAHFHLQFFEPPDHSGQATLITAPDTLRKNALVSPFFDTSTMSPRPVRQTFGQGQNKDKF
jgi:hypothetical protein